uniref:Uncharacterized protein n=1 Tax=Oryza meridionalis TaxID=40149 RepID=A0A0E0CNT9_9ORYZ
MGGGAKLSRGRVPPELGGDGAPTAAAATALACHHRRGVVLLSRLAPSTPAPWSSPGLPPCFPAAGRRGAILLLSRLAPSTPAPSHRPSTRGHEATGRCRRGLRHARKEAASMAKRWSWRCGGGGVHGEADRPPQEQAPAVLLTQNQLPPSTSSAYTDTDN